MSPYPLVVLTNNYPEDFGDAAFLANEMEYLVQEFGDVVVVPFLATGKPLVTLPRGVRATRPVFKSRRDILRAGLLGRSASLSTSLHLLQNDAPMLKSASRYRAFLLSVLMGRGVASHPPLLDVLAQFPEAPIYCFWGTGAAFGLPWLPTDGRRVIVRFHGGDLYAERHGGFIPMRRGVYEAADGLVAISSFGESELRRAADEVQVAVPITVVRLGTRDGGVGPAKALGAPVAVVSCSSVIPLKRVWLIYESMVELARLLGVAVHWTHFGGGEGLAALERLCSNPPPSLKVDLRGARSNKAVHEFYLSNRVDCFVNASTSEGVPVSIMEAFSYGIPVVATDAGGTSELVGESLGTGVLVPVDVSADGIARAIGDVVTRDGAYNPRGFWLANHEAGQQARRLVAVIRGTSA